jgi:electron-transferring-flavoprotein dehydrogenase
MSEPGLSNGRRWTTDIVCVGFGPATAGFPATSRHILNPDGTPAIESPSTPGMPLQVMCYERADDIGFGVSGVVTRARGIRATLPDLGPRRDPHGAPVRHEKVAYLLDPVGASRRSAAAARRRRAAAHAPLDREHAIELPYSRRSSQKHGGWSSRSASSCSTVGNELMASGTVQIWPGMPVAEALVERASACAACACSIRAPTARASPMPATCQAWICAPR